ncbi:hypothetical protein [Sphingobium lignivorans]|uniref:Uncharacterized protein n=1 Tax=Sphingobium lignivorans TaxID=2735886 RepID=A0ABR6NIG2_9SPHN|nr:hypothetical protein [Sphingobium lignivorans]MBB5985974.1 hypothetical protein [Sphingobium lignivorans]
MTDTERAFDDLKAKIDAAEARIKDDRTATRHSCRACRYYLNDFRGYERHRCTNPAFRVLNYVKSDGISEGGIPPHVPLQRTRRWGHPDDTLCGEEGLMWEPRRLWDGLRWFDVFYLAPLVMAASFAFDSLVLGILGILGLAGMMITTICCLSDGRWKND